jgi:hypothetical protein
MVDGEVLTRDFQLVNQDPVEIASEARTAALEVAKRAGI